MNDIITFEESSGNVFADLELEEADSLLMGAMLGSQVVRILEQRHLEQEEIATLLNIDQADVSRLMNGSYNGFSEGQLFSFLRKLNHKISIQITPHHQGEKWQEVVQH